MYKYDKPFIGPFAELLEQMLQEKRMAGLKYIESARLMNKLDELSCHYDCSNGLPKELVMDFTECKPNWHQSTPGHLITICRVFSYDKDIGLCYSIGGDSLDFLPLV
jgi:hypothetical protein